MASAAHAAIAQYAHTVAMLPGFPPRQKIRGAVDNLMSEEAPDERRNIVRVVSLDKIIGQVLPAAGDVWLALLPFDDFKKSTITGLKKVWIQQRRDFVALLALLAASPGESKWSPALRVLPHDNADTAPGSLYWINLMRELDPSSIQCDDLRETERGLIALSHAPQPQFLLVASNDPSLLDFPQLLDFFLFDHGECSPAYATLLEQCGVSHSDGLVVEIGLLFKTGKITLSMATQLVALLQRNEAEAERHRIHFRVTTIRFESECSIQAKAAEVLGQVANVKPLVCLQLGNLDDVKPALLQPCLQSLVSSESHLQRLRLDDPMQMPAIASVLRYSSGYLQSLDIPFDPSGIYAAWLAFAFFHVDSHSRVSSITLRVPEGELSLHLLTNEWMDGFKLALQSVAGSPRDLAEIEDASDDTSERIFVTVPANTTVKDGAKSGAKQLCKLSASGEYEKIGQDRKSVAIVIPGIGIGWVQATAIESTRTRPSALPADRSVVTNGVVTSFHWASEHPVCYQPVLLRDDPATEIAIHDNNLVQLLRIIGGPLERLSLPQLLLTDAQLVAIVDSSPLLKELNVSGHHLKNIQPLVDAAMDGRSRIHTLSLARDHWHPQTDPTLQQLIALLAARESKLRRLAFRVRADPPDVQQVNEIIATGFLEIVQLRTSSTSAEDGEASPPQFETLMAAHPLPLRSKAAVISCVHAAEPNQSLSRLDAAVLSRIFQFSATPVARHIIPETPLETESCDCDDCRPPETEYSP